MKFETPYTKSNPFLSSVKERENLCKQGSQKKTHHIALNLNESGISYQVGDSIGIFPTHDPELVKHTLEAMKASGDETIAEKNGDGVWKLKDFLTKKANITDVSRKLLSEIALRQPHSAKQERLHYLLQDDQKDIFKEYLAKHELWQILTDHEEVTFVPQELCHMLMPLLPRLYSISSSQRIVGDEIHLTVGLVEYPGTQGYVKRGVCTHYLCNLVNLHEPVVPIYLQPHHGFTVPDDPSTSMIMIGPGTGVAPFRAFMQERIATNASGKNWLFFGEWTRSYEFFYENFWNELEAKGKLRLDVAFSRDQEHKVYVQHKMLEHAQELYQWLQEGAILYVCGDAKRMAKDVDHALLHIIQQQGKLSEADSKAYLKHLRTEKRYLRDIY